MIKLLYKETGEEFIPNVNDIYCIRLDGKVYVQKWGGMGYAPIEKCDNLTWKLI